MKEREKISHKNNRLLSVCLLKISPFFQDITVVIFRTVRCKDDQRGEGQSEATEFLGVGGEKENLREGDNPFGYCAGSMPRPATILL